MNDDLHKKYDSYDDEVYEKLKQTIEEANEYAKQNQYDAIMTYIYIVRKIKEKKDEIDSISEWANNMIEDLKEPYREKMEDEMQIYINNVLDSRYISELDQNYCKLMEYVKMLTSEKESISPEEIIIKRNKKTLQ